MRLLYRIFLIIFIILSLMALIGCAVMNPTGKISIQELVDRKTNISDATPLENVNVELTGYVTGWVKAPANILIDQDAPSLPVELKTDQWVPSIAFVVRHPSLGSVILDMGLKNGDCDYGMRPIYWVPCQNEPRSDLVSQLKQENLDPQDIRFIIPSHLHGDHISGLNNLLAFADAPLLMTSATLSELRSHLRFAKGIPSKMLSADMDIQLIDPHFQSDDKLGESFDVFGDSSLRLFRTSGHSDGHLSALVQTRNKSVLLTFDAAHLRANFDLGIPSGSVVSKEKARESLEAIKKLSQDMPEMVLVFGHEPSQWSCSQTKPFNVLGGRCFSSPIKQ